MVTYNLFIASYNSSFNILYRFRKCFTLTGLVHTLLALNLLEHRHFFLWVTLFERSIAILRPWWNNILEALFVYDVIFSSFDWVRQRRSELLLATAYSNFCDWASGSMRLSNLLSTWNLIRIVLIRNRVEHMGVRIAHWWSIWRISTMRDFFALFVSWNTINFAYWRTHVIIVELPIRSWLCIIPNGCETSARTSSIFLSH